MGSSSQTHCKRGHEFTPENTMIKHRDGAVHRGCKACRRTWNRVTRNSKIDPDAPAMTRKQIGLYVFEKSRSRQLSRDTQSSDALWDLYCSQQNGNKKRSTCRYGHPKTKHNVSCRWTTSNSGRSRYVRADCRICAANTAKKSARKKRGDIDIFSFLQVEPEQPAPWAGEKAHERWRIERAMHQYNGHINAL